MRGHTVDHFGRFVFWLSTIGITLGVMALVTVLSMINGFEYKLQNNVLSLIPQVILSSEHGSLNPQQFPETAVRLGGTNHVAFITTGNMVLQSARSVAVGVMLGIDPTQRDSLTPYLINVKQTDLEPGRYNIILGEQLALQLGANRGSQTRMMVPFVGQFTPMGHISGQRLFDVIGTSATDSEIGGYEMLVNAEGASRPIRYSADNITGWRLWLGEPLKVDSLGQQKLPESNKQQDWHDHKDELFRTVRMEKNITGLLLNLTVTVVVLSIITPLGLIVMEKQGGVAIPQTQGLTPHQVMVVFVMQGANTGVIGAILGAAPDALLTSQLDNLIPITGVLLGDAVLPVAIEPLQVIVITLVVMTIALLSTPYPSQRTTTTQPAEALRYE